MTPVSILGTGSLHWLPETGFLLTDWSATAYESPDGLGWSAIAAPQSDVTLEGFAESQGTAVGVGIKDFQSSRERAAAWWTQDGRTWLQSSSVADLAPDPPFRGPRAIQELNAVVDAGGAFAGVGFEVNPRPCDCPGQGHTLVWGSADGQTWKRVPLDAPALAVSVDAIAASNGRLVAYEEELGAEVISPPRQKMDALWSRDGTHWQAVSIPQMVTITGTGAGFFGAGVGNHTIYASADGLTWRQVYRAPRPSIDIWAGFAKVDDEWLLIGQLAGTVIVGTADGAMWSEIPGDAMPADVRVDAVASDGRRLVLVGGQLPSGTSVTWVSDSFH
jgi:hypothetical protein